MPSAAGYVMGRLPEQDRLVGGRPQLQQLEPAKVQLYGKQKLAAAKRWPARHFKAKAPPIWPACSFPQHPPAPPLYPIPLWLLWVLPDLEGCLLPQQDRLPGVL
ncbi:hypothetical protein DSO57_1013618 [Entomophthora muscae]|uniref:Uncharacterized protein n=1 Tax=Entomophthora muscae TaxID=34485 RepID=A0ACC2SIE9_9FUNG|nr:hypothetical protein DSO57_1013618 [Entomophthora muscae]